MYRVSREGRRGTNAEPPDTPPRSMRQRVSNAMSAPPHFSNKDKKIELLSLDNNRVKLGLKVAGVLFALMLIRRIFANACEAGTERSTSVILSDRKELHDTLLLLAEMETKLKEERESRLHVQNQLADLKANDRAKAGLPESGSDNQQKAAEAEAEQEMEEQDVDKDDQGFQREDLQGLVDEQNLALQEKNEAFEKLNQKYASLLQETNLLRAEVGDRKTTEELAIGDRSARRPPVLPPPKHGYDHEDGEPKGFDSTKEEKPNNRDVKGSNKMVKTFKRRSERGGGGSSEDGEMDAESDADSSEDNTAKNLDSVYLEDGPVGGVDDLNGFNIEVFDIDPIETSDGNFRSRSQEESSEPEIHEEEVVGLVDNEFLFEDSKAAGDDILAGQDNVIDDGDIALLPAESGNYGEQEDNDAGDGEQADNGENGHAGGLDVADIGVNIGSAWDARLADPEAVSDTESFEKDAGKKHKRTFLRGTGRKGNEDKEDTPIKGFNKNASLPGTEDEDDKGDGGVDAHVDGDAMGMKAVTEEDEEEWESTTEKLSETSDRQQVVDDRRATGGSGGQAVESDGKGHDQVVDGDAHATFWQKGEEHLNAGSNAPESKSKKSFMRPGVSGKAGETRAEDDGLDVFADPQGGEGEGEVSMMLDGVVVEGALEKGLAALTSEIDEQSTVGAGYPEQRMSAQESHYMQPMKQDKSYPRTSGESDTSEEEQDGVKSPTDAAADAAEDVESNGEPTKNERQEQEASEEAGLTEDGGGAEVEEGSPRENEAGVNGVVGAVLTEAEKAVDVVMNHDGEAEGGADGEGELQKVEDIASSGDGGVERNEAQDVGNYEEENKEQVEEPEMTRLEKKVQRAGQATEESTLPKSEDVGLLSQIAGEEAEEKPARVDLKGVTPEVEGSSGEEEGGSSKEEGSSSSEEEGSSNGEEGSRSEEEETEQSSLTSGQRGEEEGEDDSTIDDVTNPYRPAREDASNPPAGGDDFDDDEFSPTADAEPEAEGDDLEDTTTDDGEFERRRAARNQRPPPEEVPQAVLEARDAATNQMLQAIVKKRRRVVR